MCDYSFTGLSDHGNCPECGVAYDPYTFVLKGLIRPPFRPFRLVGWISLALLEVVCIAGATAGFLSPPPAAALALAGFVGLLYLLGSSRRVAASDSSVLFIAGGFGPLPSAGAKPSPQLRPWSEVDAYRIEPSSGDWYRLQLGRQTPNGATTPSSSLESVTLEVGFRETENNRSQLQATLEHHLRRSSDLHRD